MTQSDRYIVTEALRWLRRGGRLILQQLWREQAGNLDDIFTTCIASPKTQWRDVPVIELPTFKAQDWYISAGRTCAAVLLNRERDDVSLRTLIRAAVLIDDKEYICIGVERFAHIEPWKKGEKIGLMIEGER